MITEDYVSFEVAKLLKEKGFDEYCGYYNTDGEYCGYCVYNHKGKSFISAPTLWVAMKWLREKHDIHIDIISRFSLNADKDVCYSYSIKRLVDKYSSNFTSSEDGEWFTYEEACEAGIKYCLENLI